MAKITVLGAGVMGSALAVPACERNEVTLVGSPIDDSIIRELQAGRHHPTLDVMLPSGILAVRANELQAEHLLQADVIIFGVSSPGIPWALDLLHRFSVRPNMLALVTKGLIAGRAADDTPLTYAQAISQANTNPEARVVGIGGPCIAKELALKIPTRVTFGAHRESVADELRTMLQTDYYRVATTEQFTELEACAALKNFLCIGVSAMIGAYKHDDGYAKNPVAGLFNQAVHEMFTLSRWISNSQESSAIKNSADLPAAFDLPGLGDLHVTVGGGRNSRLGRYLGEGAILQDVMQTTLKGVTVEGVDTGRQLLPGFRKACHDGILHSADLPLTQRILACIENNEPFAFDFCDLPQ